VELELLPPLHEVQMPDVGWITTTTRIREKHERITRGIPVGPVQARVPLVTRGPGLIDFWVLTTRTCAPLSLLSKRRVKQHNNNSEWQPVLGDDPLAASQHT
jgi:hypothetical protein